MFVGVVHGAIRGIMTCSSNRVGLSIVVVALVTGSWACSSDDERAPGISDCSGAFCGTAGGGSATPDSGSDASSVDGDGGEDADVAVVSLSGDVVRILDQDFTDTLPYEGWGYLRVPTPSGDEQVDFGGDAGPGYATDGILVGDGWFTVVPDASLMDTGVMPTYAYLRVPEGGSTSFEIPLIERAVLSTIYSGFLQPTTVRADAAHVIVVFERDGQRVSGVTVTAHPTAEAVAFDPGSAFTTEATETGLNGVALLVNVTGTGPLKWQVEGGAETSLSVVHVPGQASLVRIEVPEG